MAESEQNKSEQPTPFKLKKAREKGQVARGTDLGFFAALTAALGYFWISGAGAAKVSAQAVHNAILDGTRLGDGAYTVFSLVPPLFSVALRPVLLFAGLVFAVTLLAEMLQVGVVFSAEPLRPDFSRLNPATGFKRLFTLRLLLETLKNILKISIYGFVGYLIIDHGVRGQMGAIHDATSLLAAMSLIALRLLAGFAGVALFFALLDQLIARRDFFKKMAMSRYEVRRETREREGDPRLKQKRKQLHAEFSRLSQSLRNLKGADVVITNPNHIAVALRYDRRTMHAPRVVSVATDRTAQRLKHMAMLYSIPVVENRALARALYSRSALNRPIPEHCFQPVADIYNMLRQRAEGEAA